MVRSRLRPRDRNRSGIHITQSVGSDIILEQETETETTNQKEAANLLQRARAIQTASTRSIRAYRRRFIDARRDWLTESRKSEQTEAVHLAEQRMVNAKQIHIIRRAQLIIYSNIQDDQVKQRDADEGGDDASSEEDDGSEDVTEENESDTDQGVTFHE